MVQIAQHTIDELAARAELCRAAVEFQKARLRALAAGMLVQWGPYTEAQKKLGVAITAYAKTQGVE